MRLKHKNIFISGATSGIGLASLEQSIQEGAFVIFTARHQDAITQIQNTYPEQCYGIANDSGDITAQVELINEIKSENIKLDVVFLNAGNVSHHSFGHWTEEQFDSMININLKGPYFFLQSALPILNDGCSIILCGSTSIHIALEQSSVYAASKVALRSLVKTLSKELIEKNIRFNLLSPGPTKTSALNHVAVSPKDLVSLQEKIKNLVPIKRLAEPVEIAKAFVFLASDESKFVIGTELLIDGGVANL